MKKLTTEEFIEKARTVHGDKYDYSKVEYINSATKVCIICLEHGEFWQTPSSHLQGIGCPKCGYNKIWESRGRTTTEQFVKKARKVHGGKYNYSKVEYVNANTKVCIICPIHGEFWQMPYVHLKGQGCDKCGDWIISEKLSMGKDKFIEKAQEVHKDDYDYSEVEYVNNQTKVWITHKKCGYRFQQLPSNHLKGQGCPKCSHRSYAYTTEEFIKKARIVHGDRYKYDKTVYYRKGEQVCITCPEHGDFWQTPREHLQGFGCQKCHENRMEREWSLFLDKNNIKYFSQYKEGLEGMSLDFYLPEYNIAIECQGIQHFKPTSFCKDNDKNIDKIFNEGIIRDIKKKKICDTLGINLFYFTNIKYILKEYNLDKDFEGIYKDNIFTRKKDIMDVIKNKQRGIS